MILQGNWGVSWPLFFFFFFKSKFSGENQVCTDSLDEILEFLLKFIMIQQQEQPSRTRSRYSYYFEGIPWKIGKYLSKPMTVNHLFSKILHSFLSWNKYLLFYLNNFLSILERLIEDYLEDKRDLWSELLCIYA